MKKLVVLLVLLVAANSYAGLLFEEDFQDATNWKTRSEAVTPVSDNIVHFFEGGTNGMIGIDIAQTDVYLDYAINFAQDATDVAVNLDGAYYKMNGLTWNRVDIKVYDLLGTELAGVNHYSGPTGNNWMVIDDNIDLSGFGQLDGVKIKLRFRNYYSTEPNFARADYLSVTGTPIPEPATMTLLGLGGLFFVRRKR